MKKAIPAALGLLLALSILAAPIVLSAGIPFSADLTQTDDKGKQSLGKVFVTQDKIRQELPDAKTNEVSTTILRMDKDVVWVLMPEQKMYMEMDFNKAKMMQYATDKSADLIERTNNLGKETVSGYVCTKTEYIYKDKSYGSSIIWLSDRLQFAIKFESKNSKGKVISTTEYTNIKEGPQAASLFEIPAGYTKFSLGGMIPSFGK